MNKYDSELLAERLRAKGYASARDAAEADIIAINTCSVRGGAEDRVYGRLGELKRLKRRRPKLIIAILGCQAQREGEQLLQRAPHVDLVVGTREFPRLPELVERVAAGETPILAIDENCDVRVERGARAESGPSAFLAVMRGCDLNCTFCIVPATRGRVRSRSPEDLLEEARWLIAGGVREIVLLGQTVNAYGYDLASPTEAEALGYRRALAAGASNVPSYGFAPAGGGNSPAADLMFPAERPAIPRLAELIRRLGALPGLDRIRLVTNHVAYLDDALIDALAETPAAMPFLPLPAQSGSDRVLREMRRGYTADLYRKRIDKLKSKIPGIELSSDWIVGFPGETETDFEKSCEFLREMGFAQNFVFRYSPRPQTPAFPLPAIPESETARRNSELLRIAEEVQRSRWGRYAGRERPVLVEKFDRETGNASGKTPENLEIHFPGDASLAGEIVNVCVEAASAHSAHGVLAASRATRIH